MPSTTPPFQHRRPLRRDAVLTHLRGLVPVTSPGKVRQVGLLRAPVGLRAPAQPSRLQFSLSGLRPPGSGLRSAVAVVLPLCPRSGLSPVLSPASPSLLLWWRGPDLRVGYDRTCHCASRRLAAAGRRKGRLTRVDVITGTRTPARRAPSRRPVNAERCRNSGWSQVQIGVDDYDRCLRVGNPERRAKSHSASRQRPVPQVTGGAPRTYHR